MKSCTIRRAKKEDCETIAAILNRAFAPYEHQYTTEGFERTVLNAGQLAERLHAPEEDGEGVGQQELAKMLENARVEVEKYKGGEG